LPRWFSLAGEVNSDKRGAPAGSPVLVITAVPTAPG